MGDEQGWIVTIECEHCLEPVYSQGPTGRGHREAALLRHGRRVIPFCSPECRTVWHSMMNDTLFGQVQAADDVGPKALEQVFHGGTVRWTVEWPDD